MALRRVLSIQSHVVSGYVGNTVATLPLQLLGFDVNAIHSVQRSNHTGYPIFKGQPLQSHELKFIFDGLKGNRLNYYSHFLTGFCGSQSLLNETLDIYKQLKKTNPNLIFLCDPVMGDNDGLYVPEGLVPIYRDHLLPIADIVTPNQFETELLTGIKIKTENDALQAMQKLHEKGTNTVVLTSSHLESVDKLVLLASNKDQKYYYRLPVPLLDAVFTGTGDLFASMLLAWLHKYPDDLKRACEKTMSATQLILEKTLKEALVLAGKGNEPTVDQIELRLVQCLDVIRDPTDLFKAEVRKIP